MSGIIESNDRESWTAVDLVERFGPMPLHRVRHDPRPGSATEDDVVRLHDREDRLYELVDGILLEKTVGTYESYLAGVLVRVVGNFVTQHDLGIVLPPDGMMRLAPGLVRIPDVSFISWARLPRRCIPDQAIADLVPNLAIEVISRSNTQKEMDRKLDEYLIAGVELVWYVYPTVREVHVFQRNATGLILSESEALSGGDVLDGFSLPLPSLFGR